MKMLFIALLLTLSATAWACDANAYLINKMVKSGEIQLTFNHDGTLKMLTCDAKKISEEYCKHLEEPIFDFYHKHPKGHY